KRYSGKVCICFDGDEAGQKATLRAIEILLSLDMEPSVVVLPPEDDPDSILRKGGAETLDAAIRSAIPFFDFLIRSKIPSGRSLSPWEKNSAAADIAEYIAKIASPVLRSSFSSILAEKIGVSESTIISEMKKRRENRNSQYEDRKNTDIQQDLAGSPESQIRKAEEILLELSIMHGTFCRRIAEDLPSEMISSTPVGKAIEIAVSMTLNGEWENIVGEIKQKISEENDPTLCRILAFGGEFDENNSGKAYDDCIKIIKNYHLGKKIARLNEDLSTEKDEEKRNSIILQITEHRKEIIKLNSRKNTNPENG
ncbi:MAG TPA: toprim domain-containing protein, partial [Victivallales bacterium]|nr:toprim domain-containing protein [Victivallales bacterium]